jgi:hypothetical protein
MIIRLCIRHGISISISIIVGIDIPGKELSSVSLATNTWDGEALSLGGSTLLEATLPDMPSGSFTKQLTCRDAFPAVALSVTFPELCQLLNNSPSIASPSERLAQSFVTGRAVALTSPELCRSLISLAE